MLKSQGRSFEIHQKPTILTSISKWKWENICMDFIVGLSRTSRGYNSIWIIVDRLTKLAHLILVSTAYRIRQYVKLYMSYIIRYHGIPKTIISDRGSIMSVWAPISSEALLIIPRLTDRQNESIKSSKICFMLVFSLMTQNGTSIFH
jgi:hypothetical protein